MEEFSFISSVTFYLMVITVAVSLIALYLYSPLIEAGYLKPTRTVRENTWYELITSGFLHANFAHLFVNMFTLYFFGTIMEQVIGRPLFLGLYLSGLIVSGIPSVIKFRENPNYATLGASGGVSAVLFAYIFIFPFEKIMLMFIPFPIPAFVFAIMYLLYSMYESKQERGKVNHEAHLAGAFWGIVYLLILVPRALDHFLQTIGMG